MFKKPEILFFILSLISSCSYWSPNQTEQEDKIATSQPITYELSGVDKELKTTAHKKDYRLLAIAQRALLFPGVDADKVVELKKRCGYRVMSESSDVIKSSEDLQKQQELFVYAKTYNQRISKLCEQRNQVAE